MKLPPLLTLIIAATGFLALPARADDHDKDKKHKKHLEEYGRDHRPSVTIGVVAPRRTHYGLSSTVVEREHPVYYERRSYVGRNYSSQSVEIGIQRGLARRGYYRGPIDGNIGPGSRAAIRAFQADNGFAPTGHINGGLVDALL